MYLLDTNICIAILRTQPGVMERLRQHPMGSVRLCSVVRAELIYGARNSARVSESLQAVQAFCAPFVSLAFDDAAAQEYGLLRVQLGRMGQLIGPFDLLIAAIALAHRLILVTNNTREFARVPGLALEDWLSS